MIWYQFKPSDTLFFRGAEPLIGGINYETTIAFPPATSVISGAVRTAVLAQKSVSIQEYKNGHDVSAAIGPYGKKAPFNVVGPLIRYRDDDFVPAPYTWFTEKNNQHDKINIIKPFNLETGLKERLGLKASSDLINWVSHENEVKTIGGGWISLKGLLAGKKRFENGKSIFISGTANSDLFAIEERTGIAFDSKRVILESQLYTSRHVRLKEAVSLIWGIDRDCELDKKGILTLGGEQRFGAYSKLNDPPLFPETGNAYLSLAQVPINEETGNALIGTGKINYRGGWDLAKQFHKDMIAYYPAGSVFNQNVNHCCIKFSN